MRSSHSHAGLLAVLGAAMLVSACTGGLFESTTPTPSVYLLRVAPAAAPLTPTLPTLLVVARPGVRPGLDTDRIIVQHADRRLDTYAGGRWGGALPDVVHSLLVESLQAQGGWQGVLGEQSAFNGRFLLQTEIREFVAVYGAAGQAPTVRVSLACELGDNQARRLVSTFVVTSEQAAAGNTMHEVIAAFESAFQDAAARIAAASHTLAAAELAPPATR